MNSSPLTHPQINSAAPASWRNGRNVKITNESVTTSLPQETRAFFADELGHNHSHFMVGVARVLENIYMAQKTFPDGLPEAIRTLK